MSARRRHQHGLRPRATASSMSASATAALGLDALDGNGAAFRAGRNCQRQRPAQRQRRCRWTCASLQAVSRRSHAHTRPPFCSTPTSRMRALANCACARRDAVMHRPLTAIATTFDLRGRLGQAPLAFAGGDNQSGQTRCARRSGALADRPSTARADPTIDGANGARKRQSNVQWAMASCGPTGKNAGALTGSAQIEDAPPHALAAAIW